MLFNCYLHIDRFAALCKRAVGFDVNIICSAFKLTEINTHPVADSSDITVSDQTVLSLEDLTVIL